MQKSCKKVAEMLVDYADGQLPPSESTGVAKHLAGCPDCRSVLEGLQRSLHLAGVIWANGLAETKAIRIPIPEKTRKLRWGKYAAVAASILLIVTSSALWRAMMKPTRPEQTFAEIERRISQSGSAARLLAATDLLAKYPDAQPIVKQQYRYIVETYPETPAAAKAKLRIE